MLKTIAVWMAAYAYGSVPFIDTLARKRSVNLKNVGSGNVGATNLMSVGGPLVAVVGWLADASKGLLPVLVARRLGFSETNAVIAGVCGTAGQCWPMALEFNGGRGISAFIGAAYAIDRSCWLITLVPFIAGSLWRVASALARDDGLAAEVRAHRSRSVPLASLLGILMFPATMWILQRRAF